MADALTDLHEEAFWLASHATEVVVSRLQVLVFYAFSAKTIKGIQKDAVCSSGPFNRPRGPLSELTQQLIKAVRG